MFSSKLLGVAAILGCLLLLPARSEGDKPSSRVEPMRNFTVDLDQQPDKRWLEILSVYKSSVPLIIEYFKNQV